MRFSVLPKDVPWYAKLIELIVLIGAMIAILFFFATTPSYDEVVKGAASAIVAFLISLFTSRKAQEATKEKIKEELQPQVGKKLTQDTLSELM